MRLRIRFLLATVGQDAKSDSDSFVMTQQQLDALSGSEFSVILAKGKPIDTATLVAFAHDRKGRGVKTVTVKPEGSTRTRRFSGQLISRLIADDGRVYAFEYVKRDRASVIIDVTKKRAVVAARLESKRHKLWVELSPDDRKKAIAEYRSLIERSAEKFPDLRTYDTDTVLFVSDIPPSEARPILVRLDALNRTLAEAFGFPSDHNIWRGKAVIFAFATREKFAEFERTIINYQQDVSTVRALTHYRTDGRVIVVTIRDGRPDIHPQTVIHETTHGFTYRYLSDIQAPHWLREGLADWVADKVVPDVRFARDRRRVCAERDRRSPSLGGMLTAARISGEQFGTAASIVDLLIKNDPLLFRRLYDGLKEGLTFEDSLMRSYGMTVENLVAVYGRSIGNRNLKP